MKLWRKLENQIYQMEGKKEGRRKKGEIREHSQGHTTEIIPLTLVHVTSVGQLYSPD